MKKNITILLLVVSFKVLSQTPSCTLPETVKSRTYTILKNLDRSQIPSGVLYDLMLPISNLGNYTGSSSTDTSGQEHFLQAWHELYESSFNTSTLKTISILEDNVETFHTNKKYHHPIGIIDFEYNTLKPDAKDNNLVYVANGQLYNTPGRTTSPYQT